MKGRDGSRKVKVNEIRISKKFLDDLMVGTPSGDEVGRCSLQMEKIDRPLTWTKPDNE